MRVIRSALVAVTFLILSLSCSAVPTFTDIGAGLPGLPVGWSGTLTPTKPAYSFEPLNRSYSNVQEDISGQNYRIVGLIGISSNIVPVYDGDVAWGDYDNDGDLDLVVAGNSSQYLSIAPICKLYRNDAGVLTDTNMPLAGVCRCSVAWGDFDNDNDLDLALTGDTTTDKITKLYRNDSGNFVEVDANLPGTIDGCLAWSDYDNDGDLDLALSGTLGGLPYQFITAVFRNDGNGVFRDAGFAMTGLCDSSLAWGDFDGDGDLDLAASGKTAITSGVCASKIYRNDGGVLVGTDLELPKVHEGGLKWGDYDSDGDLDLAVSGASYDYSTMTLKILRNDAGALVNSNVVLPQMNGDVDWCDYDNDGDLDLSVSGYDGSHYLSKILRNDGAVFVDSGIDIEEISGACAWGDYDSDGDLDLVITGRTSTDSYNTAPRCQFLMNDSRSPNTAPSAPNGLTATASAASVTFGWNAATDAETPAAGLSYNLRVGSAPGRSDFVASMADPSMGLRRIPSPGNSQSSPWKLRLPPGTHYWSVQAIDSGMKGSAWSAEQAVTVEAIRISGFVRNTTGIGIPDVLVSTGDGSDWQKTSTTGFYELQVPPGWSGTVTATKTGHEMSPLSRDYTNVTSDQLEQNYTSTRTFTDIGAGLPAARCSGAWGDYDNDGDLDLAVSGSGDGNTTIARVYRNDDGTFVDAELDLAQISGAVGWGDYDNDGDLDLALSGACYTTKYEYLRKIYRNDGGSFTDIGANLGPEAPNSLAWGDYDNDGDLDLAFTSSGYNYTSIYGNDGGTFVGLDDSPYGVEQGCVAWADFDNDSDLDLAMTGWPVHTSQYQSTRIYRNDNGAFGDINADIPDVGQGSSLAWGDYDNDGDPDLAVAGRTYNSNRVSGIYRNDSGSFVDIGAGLPGIETASLAWGDYDNDGDLDLALAGTGLCKIYRNDGGEFTDLDAGLQGLTDLYRVCVAWGDYDNDRKLDLFVSGNIGASGNPTFVTRIYHNNGTVSNTPPSPPAQLSSQTLVRSVTFKWQPASDTETPASGLTYNLRVGSTPGGDDIFCGMADSSSGVRKLPAIGNAQQTLSWNLKGLASGNCHWSVQAIDTAFSGSAWAPEQIAVVNVNKISGHIRSNNGRPLWGVVVGTGDATIETYTTADDGYYELWVPAGWSGSVTPSKQTYGFTPESRPYTDVAADQQSQDFTGIGGFIDTRMVLLGVRDGSFAWGDYDNDGDLDLALSGLAANSTPSCRIYRNDNGTLTDSGAGLPGISGSCMAWGDYDGDGDLDLVAAGDGTGGPITRIFRNDVSAFTVIDAGLPGVSYGGLAWGDYDNDGDLDLVLEGGSGSGRFTRIYRNDKGTFSDINAGLPITGKDSVSWADYDNDSDLDLLIAGTGESSAIAKLYRNDGGIFTETDSGFAPSGSDKAAWGDYDTDGDLDVVLGTRLYRNDGGHFTQVIALPDGRSAAWGDYDNDGDLDLAIAGMTGPYRYGVYRNENGVFANVTPGFEQLEGSWLAWGDYDNDNDLDLLVAGYTQSSNYFTRLYRNDGGKLNTAPAAPTEPAATIAGPIAAFTWNAAFDAETPVAGLSYNLRVGTTPGSDDVFSGAANLSSGYRKVPALGNSQKNTSWRLRLPDGVCYWSVQAIDAAFAGSPWSEERSVIVETKKICGFIRDENGMGVSGVSVRSTDGDSFATAGDGYYEVRVSPGWSGDLTPVKAGYVFDPAVRSYTDVTLDQPDQNYSGRLPFVDIGAGLVGMSGVPAWGDYDRDGDLDLALTGSYYSYGITRRVSKIYRNNGGVFADIGANIAQVGNSSLAWGDYDNDGDLDLALVGSTSSGRICKVYRNEEGSFVDINANMTISSPGTAVWVDYDNDGDLDLAVGATIFRSDGSGVFTKVDIGLFGSQNFAWGDYDSDGDMDFVTQTYAYSNGSFGPVTVLYRNDAGRFVDANANLIGASGGALAWGDYDNDGDLDLVVTGSTTSGSPACVIYRNDAGVFTDIGAGLPGMTYAHLIWGDCDNDGDLDLAITGATAAYSGYFTRIYRNDDGVFTDSGASLPAPSGGRLAFGDYDSDGDLDLALMGNVSSTYVSRIYRNNSYSHNTSPAPPGNLHASASGNALTFSWSSATDQETAIGGLSYNLRVGTTPGDDDIFCGMANPATGFRWLPALGNAQKNLSWTLRDLPAGAYYWSVQSIDAAFAGSSWAADSSVVVPMSIAQIKTAAGEHPLVGCSSMAVTAVFDGYFYIEADNRSIGIGVNAPQHAVTAGMRVDVTGNLGLTSDGECRIDALTVTPNGSGTVEPLFMSGISLSGGPFGRQDAVWENAYVTNPDETRELIWRQAIGLNSTGLLIKVCGRVTQIDAAGQYFYIDDGSGLMDGTTTAGISNVGLRVALNGEGYQQGQLLTITSISSCFKGDDGRLRRLLRVAGREHVHLP